MPRQVANKEELKTQATDVFSASTAITETVNLPTRGLIKGVPEQIILKAIQRKDKKKLLMSETNNTLLSLLQSSIISPKDFNVYNLLPFEADYLLYRLRILTYGSDHTFKSKCPTCGFVNDVEYDLNDVECLPVPDDFSLTFNVPPLPISGVVITCKLLTEGDLVEINKVSDNLEKNTGNKSAYFDTLWETRIVAINGNKLSPIETTQFLDELNDYDNEYLMEYYNVYSANYGLQTKLHFECDNCHNNVETKMPSIYTFFRPTIKIPPIK